MARIYLGGIMAAMGLLQLAGWSVFVDAVESYQAGGRSLAVVLGTLLIGGELLAALGLLTDRRFGATAALAVMVLWSALGVQAFARGLALENCGCFGALWRQELRWWILLEDAYLLGLSAWLLWRTRSSGRPEVVAEGRSPDPVAAGA